ncbi:MAG: shikimate kinase [Caldithrix sp.]|nr:MAG: shikimate kinase [Caldithrix sp.]
MNFVILFGPLAVGKMTVGQELEKITDLKLFHNHMTIEMVLPYFDMKSSSFKKLVNSFRIQLIKEVAKSDLAGLIFTYVWQLDSKKDCDFMHTIVNIFEQQNATICYVELEASAAERLKRNKSPNRLKYKPSKNDLLASEMELLETDDQHILNSEKNEFRNKNHLKINNTNLSAHRVAGMIRERFGL